MFAQQGGVAPHRRRGFAQPPHQVENGFRTQRRVVNVRVEVAFHKVRVEKAFLRRENRSGGDAVTLKQIG